MPDINITYSKLAPLLKTGDIVLVHGDTKFQEVLELLTKSSFIHSAMVVLSKDIGLSEKTAPILLWESTPYTITIDQELQKPKAGPTLVDLETRINDELSNGIFTKYVFRRLEKELGADNFTGLKKAIQELYPDKFPTDWWFFVKGIIGRLFNREVKQSTYFCSELVAHSYQRMGLLSYEHPADYYEPKDFSTTGHLDLLNNQFLDEEMNLEIGLKE
ncbi:MAG: hypothetical protein ABI861_02400 [Panacibacter sp.]